MAQPGLPDLPSDNTYAVRGARYAAAPAASCTGSTASLGTRVPQRILIAAV